MPVPEADIRASSPTNAAQEDILGRLMPLEKLNSINLVELAKETPASSGKFAGKVPNLYTVENCTKNDLSGKSDERRRELPRIIASRQAGASLEADHAAAGHRNLLEGGMHQADLLGKGLLTGLILNPANGLSQLCNKSAGTNFKKLEFANQSEVESSVAGGVGSILGNTAWFVALSAAGRRVMPSSWRAGIKGESLSFGATGAIQGLLTPTDDKLGGTDFVLAKGVDVLLGGSSAVLGAQGGRLAKGLVHSAPALGVKGAATLALAGETAFNGALGAGSTQAYSLMKTGKFASREDSLNAAYLSAGIGLGGAMLSVAARGAKLPDKMPEKMPGKVEAKAVSENAMPDAMSVAGQPGHLAAEIDLPKQPVIEEIPPAMEFPLERTNPIESRTEGFRLDEGARRFVERIARTYETRAIEEESLHRIIENFPHQDRSVAIKVLQHGLPNSSELLFDTQMKTLRTRLETALVSDGLDSKAPFISVDEAGWGKAFGYLYRKLSKMENRVTARDPEKLPASARAAVLLDDPAAVKYSPEQIAALRKLDKVYVLGPMGFERGLNFFDYAQGEDRVGDKLRQLVSAVKSLKESHPAASEEQLIDLAVRAESRAGARQLNENVEFISTDDALPGRFEVNGQAQGVGTDGGDYRSEVSGIAGRLNAQKATPAKIESFLRQYVPDNQQPAAYTLAEGGKHISYRDMFGYADSLIEQIEASRKGTGSGSAKVLFENPNANDSVDLVNYMYRLASGTPREHFVKASELDELARSGQLKDNLIVFLDEHILTGDKIGKRYKDVRQSAEQSGGVIFASMLRDNFPIFGEEGAPSVPCIYLKADSVKKFYPSKWDGATEKQLDRAYEYAADSGFVTGQYGDPRIDFMYPTITSNSTNSWSFAVPDNAVSVVRRFSQDVLGLRQTRDELTRPLEPALKHYSSHLMPRQDIPEDMLQNGTLKVEFDKSQPNGTGTILQGDLEVPVAVEETRITFMDDPQVFLDAQRDAAQLHQALNLTPRYPRTALRHQDLGNGAAHYLVLENPAGEPLLSGLGRLSGQEEMERPADIAALLRDKPQIRQIVESSLAERLIVACVNAQPQQLMVATDGSPYLYNGRVFRLDSGSKPRWSGIEYPLRKVFEASELSDGVYSRLLAAYDRLSTDLRLNSRAMVLPVMPRLEWLLENRRFPGLDENDYLIY